MGNYEQTLRVDGFRQQELNILNPDPGMRTMSMPSPRSFQRPPGRRDAEHRARRRDDELQHQRVLLDSLRKETGGGGPVMPCGVCVVCSSSPRVATMPGVVAHQARVPRGMPSCARKSESSMTGPIGPTGRRGFTAISGTRPNVWAANAWRGCSKRKACRASVAASGRTRLAAILGRVRRRIS